MSAKVNPVVAQRSSHSFSKHVTTPLTSCILCRVLSPRVLPHRHVLLDYSEAKILLCTTMRRYKMTAAIPLRSWSKCHSQM